MRFEVNNVPNFYVVATPIGNLKDISQRALDVLKEVDLILCEDTRVTKKLLSFYDIQKPLESYHKFSKPEKIEKILNLLEGGKNLALVSDAGTPGISDPGGFLVKKVFEKFGNEVKTVPIPGANAVITALSVSGFFSDQFKFLGFPPHKKGRKTFFENIAKEECAQVFYESKHRIQKALLELKKVMPERELVLCRELTKQFESIYRGNAESCLKQLEADKILGEFVVVVAGK